MMSSEKVVPGLVSASATGITVHAQEIRWFGEVYELAETEIAIAWSGEPTRHLVWLTPAGLVHATAPASEPMPPVDGALCYLASLRLLEEGDTPASVLVDVPRLERRDAAAADARRIAVPAGLLVPGVPPDVAAARARAARVRAIDGLLAGKRAGSLTAADRTLVIERLALLSGMEP